MGDESALKKVKEIRDFHHYDHLLCHITCYKQLQIWSEYRWRMLPHKVQTIYQTTRRHNPE